MPAPLHILIAAASLLFTGFACASESAFAARLACIPEDQVACGCQIRIPATSCAAAQASYLPQAFFPLSVGAPLLLNVDGKLRQLTAAKKNGRLPDRGSKFPIQQTFGDADMQVRIEFTSAKSTCGKAEPEACEYTDVNATLHITEHGRARVRLRGSGACGC